MYEKGSTHYDTLTPKALIKAIRQTFRVDPDVKQDETMIDSQEALIDYLSSVEQDRIDTLLIRACQMNHFDLVPMMLSIRDEKTPLTKSINPLCQLCFDKLEIIQNKTDSLSIGERESCQSILAFLLDRGMLTLNRPFEVGKKRPLSVLTLSIEYGLQEIPYLINQRYFNPRQYQKNGLFPIHQAIQRYQAQFSENLVMQAMMDKEKREHLSNLQKRKEIACHFIEIAKDINQTDRQDKTPLHHAIDNNAADIVAKLLAHEANPNFPSHHGSPLHYAIEDNRIEIITLFCNTKDCDLNQACPLKLKAKPFHENCPKTPLMVAVLLKQNTIAKILIDNIKSPNKTLEHYDPASGKIFEYNSFYCALSVGNTEIAERIRKKTFPSKPIDPSLWENKQNYPHPLILLAQNNDKHTLLYYLKYFSVSTPLLKKACRLLIKNKEGTDCLAVIHQESKILPEKPHLIYAINKGNKRLLQALLIKQPPISKIVLDHVAKVYKDATQKKQAIVSCLFQEANCDAPIGHHNKQTPLVYIINKGYCSGTERINLFDLIIPHVKFINTTVNGITALGLAASKLTLKEVNQLIKYGADPRRASNKVSIYDLIDKNPDPSQRELISNLIKSHLPPEGTSTRNSKDDPEEDFPPYNL